MNSPVDRFMDTVEWEAVPPPAFIKTGDKYATHQGVVEIAGKKLRCYQLNTGERVFDGGDVESFFSDASNSGPPVVLAGENIPGGMGPDYAVLTLRNGIVLTVGDEGVNAFESLESYRAGGPPIAGLTFPR